MKQIEATLHQKRKSYNDCGIILSLEYRKNSLQIIKEKFSEFVRPNELEFKLTRLQTEIQRYDKAMFYEEPLSLLSSLIIRLAELKLEL